MTESNASLLSNPYVRAGILGCVVIGVAVAARETVKYDAAAPERERSDLFAHVASMHGVLNESFAHDTSLDIAHTAWFPEALRCGVGEHVVTEYPAPWDAIARRPKEGEHTVRVQMKLVHPKKASKEVTWYARRDTDCDGIYETYQLDATLGEEAEAEDVKVQNIGE